ncbi:MAG: YajG family lipoprotein [Sulfurimonas sp.]
MKNLFYVVIIALLMGGCTYKNEALNLPSYKADYAGAVSADKKSVYVSVIKDMRKDKRGIGYVMDDGQKIARLYSDVNFPAKYKEGLGYALNIAGFNTDVSAENASLIMEVYIRNIEIIYSDKSFDKNLVGEIEIEVIIKRDGEVITQNFRQKGGKWIVKSYESKDLEPFLHSLFSDSINDIVSRLTRY